MLVAPLAGLSLLLTISVGPLPNADTGASEISFRQKTAAIQPLIRSATQCIAQRVAADPRYGGNNNLNDLIVDSVPSCVDALRAMIDAHDRYFGGGSGEMFFSGPYLDILPTAVSRWISKLKE
ncbi:MAG: hypothetical protein E6G97_00735 [Alphaproteobacteria bacterium]|nr:MAG: hypothetical protein E6G97_00735 [Alphaproteobacteria bacterium]